MRGAGAFAVPLARTTMCTFCLHCTFRVCPRAPACARVRPPCTSFYCGLTTLLLDSPCLHAQGGAPEGAHNMVVKDAMRAGNCIKQAFDAWFSIIQTLQADNPELANSCLNTLQRT